MSTASVRLTIAIGLSLSLSGLASACGSSTSSGDQQPNASNRDAAPDTGRTGAGGGTSNGSDAGPSAGGATQGTGGSSQAGGPASLPEGGSTESDAAADTGTVIAVGPYPAGPYGNAVGNVFADLSPLSGYEDLTGVALANTEPWEPKYSLQNLRETGAPYALLHVSAFFCPGCRHAATDLGMLGKSVLDAGGQIVEILSLGSTHVAATRADLDAWIEAYNLDVTSMIGDPTNVLLTASHREDVYILEMPSMKVVYAVHGDTTGRTPSSIGPAVTQILQLLGK